MTYFDPVQVDIIFQETMRLLAASPSERIQLNLIDRFLDFIDGNESKFESYLEQLLFKLPQINEPLLYAGIDPQVFENFIIKVIRAQKHLSSDQNRDQIGLRIQQYQAAVKQIYTWIGELSEEKLPIGETKSFKKRSKEPRSGVVLVPTVEQMDGVSSGRLRKLRVEIVSQAKTSHELSPTFGVIGAYAGTFAKPIEQAVATLLESTLGSGQRYWNAVILFETSHSWHAGRSANLAIAGAFYAEILKKEESQEQFWLNPAACITGELDELGQVEAVSAKTLELKIEAAFFSWAQLLVVPLSQLEEATAKLNTLNERYPNRELPVVAVSHLRELFFDRRVSLYHKTDALNHNLRKIWKKKNATIIGGVIVALLLIIGRLVYGPVDRNPVSVEFAGSTINLQNMHGITVKSFEVGDSFVRYNTSEYHNLTYLIKDVDKDGINEFIYSPYNESSYRYNDSLFCYSISGDSLLWKIEIEHELDYSHRSDLTTSEWNIISIEALDENSLLAVAQSGHSYPSVLGRYDLQSGELVSRVVNAGRITDFLVVDSNADGKLEIYLLAQNNSFWGATLILLDENRLKGHLPSGIDHRARDVEEVEIIGLVAFPKSIIGQQYRMEKGTMGRSIRFNDKYKTIVANVLDVHSTMNILSPSLNPSIFYTFNKNLELVALGSNDSWDIMAKKFYENGTLSFRPGNDYLNAFKDSLEWWDGEKFVNYPTLANPYPGE